MSQAHTNATEILANALYEAPFFFFVFSPHFFGLRRSLSPLPSFSLFVLDAEPKVVALY